MITFIMFVYGAIAVVSTGVAFGYFWEYNKIGTETPLTLRNGLVATIGPLLVGAFWPIAWGVGFGIMQAKREENYKRMKEKRND